MPSGVYPRPSLEQRLKKKLTRQPNGCLTFPSQTYGLIKDQGRTRLTHRVAWELANGPIPDGLQVLHTCDTPPCCEPSHLFLGTQAENLADMDSKGRRRSHSEGMISCHRGHLYDDQNTITDKRGFRSCRTCKNAARRLRRRAGGSN